MAFNLDIKYDPDKYFEISEGVRNIYKTAADPSSMEAQFSVANIITDAFPHIDPREARKNSQKIIEGYTGHELDTQGAWEEFKKTFKAQSQRLEISNAFSRAYMLSPDSEEFQERIKEAEELVDSMPLIYRNDFKDMSLFSDLLVETGRLAPSMLPSIGIYVAGGALAGATGGASMLAARGAGALYSGMMEAGGVAQELYGLRDEKGNKLSHEEIRAAWALTMAGVGALNLVTTKFETATKNAVMKLFGKQSIKDMVKSGTVRSWGLKLLSEKGKNIGSEALEESVEELIGMVATNHVLNKKNESEDTLFEGHSREEIIKTMAETAVATAKGMVLGGLPTEAVNAVVDYNSSNTKLKREANKFSGYDKDSYAVDASMIKAPKVKAEKDFSKFEAPVEVVRVDNQYVVKNPEDAGKLKAVLSQGAQALNVHVVNDVDAVNRMDAEESATRANNIAKNLEDAKVKNNQVIFKTPEEAKKRAKEFATERSGISGYFESEDGSITVTKNIDGKDSAVVFTTEEVVQDAKAPVEQDIELNEGEVLESAADYVKPVTKRTYRNHYNNYKKQLQAKGATEEDMTVLNARVLTPIHDAIRQKSPELSTEQAYELAMPSAYLAYQAARVAGMSPKEFLETKFSPEAFVALTEKQEQDYLTSQEGQESIAIEGRMQNIPEGSKPMLGGLVFHDNDGKATIGIGSGYTPLTVVHELGHVLVDTIKDTDAFQPFKDLYATELQQDGGVIGRSFQERFAGDLELYIKEGKARDKGLQKVFKRIVDAIKDFIKYQGHALDEQTKLAFDDLLDIGLQETREPTTQRQQDAADTYKQLDLFGDPDTQADTLAQLEFRVPDEHNKKIAGRKKSFIRVIDEIVKYSINDPDVERDITKIYMVYPFQEYFRDMEVDDKMTIKPNGILARPLIIEHATRRHSEQGLTKEKIREALSEIDNPVAILSSARIEKRTKRRVPGRVILTSVTVPYKGNRSGKAYLMIGVENQDIGGGRIVTMAKTVMPWIDDMQEGVSIEGLPASQRVLAINKKRWSQITGNLKSGGPEFRSPSGNSVVEIQSGVNENQTHASIEFSKSLYDVKDDLKNGIYVKNRDLNIHAGDPEIDWEIQFRKIWDSDPEITDQLRDAYNQLQSELEEGEIADENTRLLEILDETIPEDERIDIGEEAGDVNRFLERAKRQLNYIPSDVADKKFLKQLANDDFVISTAERVTEGRDISETSNISPYLFRLARHDNPTTYSIRKARQAIREDARFYRHLLLLDDGNYQQYSYESAMMFESYHESEGRMYENSEVKKILSSNVDPAIKSLIRRNLASGDVLQGVIDGANAEIESVAQELGTTREKIEAAFRMMDRDDEEYARRNALYMELQDINRKNREKYNRLKNSIEKKQGAMKARVAMERLVRKGDRMVKSSPNYDARLMKTLRGFWTIMKSEVGKKKKTLNDAFTAHGLEYDTLPELLKGYFEVNENGDIHVKKTLRTMTLTELQVLHEHMKKTKEQARDNEYDRRGAREDRVSDTIMQYYAKSMGIDAETMTQTVERLKEKKGEYNLGERGNQKGKFKAMLDTQFTTFSRLINKIDPSGTLYEWFFGENGVDDILARENEKIFERYDSARELLESKGIKPNDLNKEFIRFKRTDRDKVLTVNEAVGVYIYSKQPQGFQKLVSVDGNGFKQDEVMQIREMIQDNEGYLEYANFLLEDMKSRFPALSDTYYKVSNRVLGYVANYFPLVRGDSDAKFEDMMDEQYHNQRETPDSSMTFKRTGADYALDLNATAVWHKMVAKQEHYIAASQWVNDTQHMLRKSGGDLYSAIELTHGEMYAKAVEDFVDRFAHRRHVFDTADKIANHIRSNLVVARLGFNILTALKQVPSLMYFTSKFGPGRMIESLGQVLFHMKDVEQKIYSLAPQLRNRSFSHGYELVTNMQGNGRYERAVKTVGKAGMAPIKFMDRLVVDTLWLGAYNSNIAKGMTSEQAARDATRFIGDTQPGGSVVDTAAIYSTDNAMVKYLLMFTSQLNKNFNMIWADIPMAIKQKQYRKALGYMMGLGLAFSGIMLASGDFFDDDDDEESITRKYLAQIVNQMPLIGSVGSAFIRDQYYPSSEMLIIPETHALIKALQSGDEERIKKNWAKMGLSVSEVSGLPSGIGTKIYNSFKKDEEMNLGYMLNSAWAKHLSD